MENESTEIQNASAERTAQDYIDAANKVIEIAEIAVSFIPGGAAATKAAKIATKAVPLARGAIKAAPAIAPVVSPFAKKAADAVAGKAPEALSAGAEKVAGAAKGAAATLGAAKDKAAGAVRSAADARAQERARKTARKTLLDGAGIRMSAETFLENWSTSDKLGVTPGRVPWLQRLLRNSDVRRSRQERRLRNVPRYLCGQIVQHGSQHPRGRIGEGKPRRLRRREVQAEGSYPAVPLPRGQP